MLTLSVVGERRPSPDRSTHPLFDLVLDTAEGPVQAVGKRAPAREARVATALAAADLAVPAVWGSIDDLLLLERVPAVPLWQCGIAAWEEAARTLGRLHRHAPCSAVDGLDGWWNRVRTGPAGAVLGAAAQVVVHGEAYPANVLVRSDGRACLVDWETAALGPAALDLAALAVGWPSRVVDRLLTAHASTGPHPVTRRELAAARLLWAQRWLADPPPAAPSGAVDWRAEARAAEEELRCAR